MASGAYRSRPAARIVAPSPFTERTMKTLSLGLLGVVLVASAAAPPSTGGWAVVKVQKVPDAWIAGKPLQLTWEVRQHGETPLHDLRPTLEARSGSRRVTGRTWAFDESGVRG